MKIKGLREQRPERQKKKGVALLTVLTVMSLATILVLTFFTMAQSELESATSYSQGMEAKHLSETAVNMVIGQIRSATTGSWGQATPPQAKAYSWASQPGVIRNYEVSGTMAKGFKLYSDDRMVETVEADLVIRDVADLKTWSSNPAVFVDLNEPVIRGNKVFYPIVDPRAKSIQEVEGFDYSTADVGRSPLAQAVKRADSQADSLPMPVKWLYQLEDGTMGYMQAGGSKGRFVPLGGGGNPTEQNPIVGRVAFWTDDESSKLNVNTAAGGMVWDTPRTGGDIDRNFGRYQPAAHEWQRYPAHPATTSLSPVFFPGKADIVLNRKAMDMIYALTPRVVGGGSRAGSMKAQEPNGLVPDKDRLYPSLDEFILRPDRTENEFPTQYMKRGGVAQLLERARFFLTATSRAPEVTLFNTPRVSIWPTYNKRSSSDEKYATPFDNLIRFTAEVGVNPSSSNKYDRRNIYHFQRENADSSTFDYNNIKRNRELYAYLDDLMETNIPGFGGNFKSKYGNNNQNQLLTEIFDYIRSTNLFDDTIYGENWKSAFTSGNGDNHRTYTNFRKSDKNERGIHMGHGQVTPIQINKGGVNTRGFGRFYSIVEVGVQLICCADGNEGAWSASGGQGGDANDRFQTQVSGGGGKSGVPYPENGKVAYSNYPPGTTGPGPEGQAANHNNMLAIANGGQPLNPGEKIVQAAILFKMFSPSQGWVPINPDFKFDVSGAGSITIGGKSGLFPGSATWKANGVPFTGVWSGRHYGGNGGFRSLMRSSKKIKGRWGRVAPGDSESASDYNTYPWISRPFKITGNVVAFSGATLTIKMYSNVDDGGNLPSSPQSPAEVIQTISLNLSKLNGNMPTPSLSSGRREYINEFGVTTFPEASPGAWWSLSNDGAFLQGQDSADRGRLSWSNSSPYYGARFIKEGDTVWSMGVPHGDYRLLAARMDPGSLFEPHPYAKAGEQMGHTFYSAWGNYWGFAGSGRHEGSRTVDPKLQLVQISESRGHAPTPLWRDSVNWNLYGDFDNGMGNAQDGPYINKADEGNTHSLNRPAPGSVPKTAYDMRRDYGDFPYFVREYIHEPGGPSYFSPNRIMPGPGVFGSLPTAALDNQGSGLNNGAWQTLLFRPDIVGNGYTSHPGALSPKDHLIMDLFWMPVVEPYAISETLSTAGKINMNYQILPFSYIKRSTGLHGVFKSEVMMTVPNKHAKDYKSGSGRGAGYHWKYSPYGGTLQQKSMRTFIVADKTLQQFETEKFSRNQIFKSATEICDIFLIPQDIGEASGFSNQAGTYTPTVAQMRSGKYNRDHAVVGDNGRERPYADIYPRLTTKSNTFKVHFRAQVLKKAKGRPQGEWDPEYDQPVGEYRGSTVIERYIDPNDQDIPDYATASNAQAIDRFYRYRVLNTRRFSP
ncbi:MAG: Verru_Chthon cassette protein A [Verrucomicrobiota bacterium]